MRTTGVILAAVLALVCPRVCHAQVPHQMNYQVMLTDDADQPLADTSVQLVFRLYDVDAGGGALWTETHNTDTNSIGVASVVLGSISPMSLLFDTPLWLQVEVDGEIMSPRRPLSAAPYALRARDADHLGGEPALAYALDDDLWQPGTLNNPANPLEWTKLKSVPAGFADGTDNTGPGDGHSLDASDGDPVDVVSVDAEGKTFVGTATPDMFIPSELHVTVSGSRIPGTFDTDSYYSNVPAVYARSTGSLAVLGNAKISAGSMTFPLTPAGICGTGNDNANGGQFTALGTGIGLVCGSAGEGAALQSTAYGTGRSGHFVDGAGVFVELDDASPALRVNNARTSLHADGGWFTSESGASSSTWTLYSRCYSGRAGYFNKYTDDNEYVGHFVNEMFDSEGIYVYGTVVSTGSAARVIETSRGREAVLGVSSAELEVIASGKGRLAGGASRVEFDRLFSESISGADDLRVTATPIGGWSALYVAGIDGAGFDLRSDAGDADVEFHWVAVGRAAGNERRPEITIPDDAETERLAQKKEEEVLSRPQDKREGPGVVTVDGASRELVETP